MKRLGHVLGNLLAVALTVFSLQALAEPQAAGRNFDHATTGFPLTGGHATAACETCHVGGVFKGTPRTCDGCHAVGRRIVATPKSSSHIVTDAPCQTCHFNASTWLGARYNHGTAMPGQCVTCHNGRITTGKPASHSTGAKATASCDNCHRTYAFLPASWNHTGVAPGTCESAGCHVVGSNQYTRASVITRLGKPHTGYTGGTATQSCDVCHNFVRWIPATHMPLAGTCSSCHNGAAAEGPRADHLGWTGWPTECNQCHTSTITWSGALGGMPSNHIPFTTGTQCASCHTGTSVVTGPTLHGYLAGQPCTTCHLSGAAYYWPNNRPQQKSVGHEGMRAGDDCSKSGCHRPLGSRGTAYINWN